MDSCIYGPLMEEWKNIKGFEGIYSISNYGVIKSYDKIVDYGHCKALRIGKIKRRSKLNNIPNTYLVTSLTNKPLRYSALVHRLVAIAFVPNPENKPEVNHKNGIKDDPFVLNLEWNTVSENIQHAYDNGFKCQYSGEQHYASKLTDDNVIEIRRLHSLGIHKQREIADMFGVALTTISAIVLNINWNKI